MRDQVFCASVSYSALSVLSKNDELVLELENHTIPLFTSARKRWESIISKDEISKNIFLLRILLLFILISTGLIFGTLLGYIIYSSRQRYSDKAFDGLTRSNFRAIQRALTVKTLSSIQVALDKGLSCPSPSDWPNCPFSSNLLNRQTKVLSSVGGIDYFYVAPIVTSANRQSFKDFAQTMIESDRGFPPGILDLGNFTVDEYLSRIPLPYHSNSTFDISIPVTEISIFSKVSNILFKDIYSDERFHRHTNEMIHCISNFQSLTLHDGDDSAQFGCNFMSAIFPMETTTTPVGFIATPITPYFSPSKVVGFLGTQFSWQSLLESVLMDATSFDLIIKSSSQHHHFSIRNGQVSESEGHHGRSPPFHRLIYGQDMTRTFTTDDLTVTYYSSHEDDTSDYLAIIAFFSCLGITVLISGIFITFNTLVEEAAQKTETLLSSKRVFVRFISHEIRTPLNTVILGLHLLEEHLETLRSLSQHQEEGVNVVTACSELIQELHDNTTVAVNTLNDLINYDKIESKTFSIEKKPVKIWSVIKQTVGLLSLQANEKRVEIKMEFERNSSKPHNNYLSQLRVSGDSIKLGQVIRNIVSNALKFTPSNGEIVISVRYEPFALPAEEQSKIALDPSSPESTGHNANVGRLILTVSDTGPGLSLEQQQSLFGEGVQFNPNELQAGQGSGLGLWISKEIISLHHGEITVMSEGLGRGATFQVILPIHFLDDTCLSHGTNRTAPTRPVPKFFTQPSAAERHILVVDDAPSNRKILCRILKSHGFICHEAENGQECVDMVLAGEYPYEFILLDSEMPVLDGPSAARRLREEKCDLLIIGVTGNVLPEDKEHFIRHGVNMVMSKPLEIDELFQNINEYRQTSV